MYDVTKRDKIKNLTVKQLIEKLEGLPGDAKIDICGSPWGYIHVEKDGTIVNIDCEDLDDEYIKDPETLPDDFWENCHKISQIK